MKKIMILFIAVFIFSLNLSAQSYSGEPSPVKKYFKANFENLIHPAVIYSYQNTSYYDQEFVNKLDDKSMKREYSDEYVLRWTVYPIMLDAGINVSRFTENDIKITTTGYNFSGSLCLPHNIHIPKLFYSSTVTPFIGLGKQFYSKSENKYEISAPYWKTGVMLNLWHSRRGGSLIVLNAEYKQSIDTDNIYSFNQYSTGIGLRGKAIYYPVFGVLMFLYNLIEFEGV